MKDWWEKVKKPIIVLGVVGIMLALFLVPAFARAKYESDLGVASQFGEQSMFSILPEVITDIFYNLKVSFFVDFSSYFYWLKIFFIIYLVFAIYCIYKLGDKKEYENIEHGSADWCKPSEAYTVLHPKQGVILADKYYFPVNPEAPSGKNGNMLIIGGSGAGKSASFVIPNALQLLGSYVFTDPKGELYDRTAGFYKKQGYDVHVINLVDPKCSDGYNPLAHIRSTHEALDVDTIVKIISTKDSGGAKKGGDPFWDQTSEALLKAVIYYILYNRPKEEHSLASCLALVRLGGENEGDDLRNLFMDLPFDNPARKAFETIRLGSDKTFANILISLAAKLEAFDSPDIAAMTSTNTIEFSDLVDRKSVLYFITPATNDTYNFIMNVFFSQMLDRLYDYADSNGGKLPTPLFLILDEFANIGRIPRFEQILSTCRSYRINISIILQSIDQLIAIYDEKVTENIMANCSTHLFLGSNAQKTLETFSKQLGEKTISRDSVSRSTDKDSQLSGRSYSDQIMARALMTPDELRRMDSNTCIILLQAMKPIKAQKYFYFKMHPLWAEASKLQENHRDIGAPQRGYYKVTNPYELQKLDDIFGPSPAKSQAPSMANSNPFAAPTPNKTNNSFNEFDIDTSNLVKAKNEIPRTSATTTSASIDPFDFQIDSNVAPAKAEMPKTSGGNINQKAIIKGNGASDVYDLQAELEKKFDELFGPSTKKPVTN